jgi:hypothetical protein
MDTPAKTVPVFELVEMAPVAGPTAPGDRPLHVRGGRETAVRVVETSVDALAENMASFVGAVDRMIMAAAKVAGEFCIDKVEVQCQVSGNGKIGFAGTGVGVEGSASLKLIFARKAG